MEAIILAGGFGTRLRHVVADKPKSMAPVAGRPFMEILLSSLEQKGFSRVILSLGFMAENISGYFGNRFAGVDLTYVVEETPLGTGGALRLAAAVCTKDHFFVFNGDTFIDLEVQQLEHEWLDKQGTIVVGRHVSDTARYGRLVINGDRITKFTEKGIHGPGVINAGCYVMAMGSLNNYPLYQPFSLEKDYLEREILKSKIHVFMSKGKFIDIGTPEDYLLAQSLLSHLC
jgi:D-glycero-alpha-D-manno-heptose 1-phosphate guanylyltransferase